MTDSAKTSAASPAPAGARGGAGTQGVTDEFAHIPTPRTRHPVLALAAASLALFLVVHVRHDLRYALSSGEPLELGDARVTFSPRTTVTGLDNRYVRVRATPDRASGLEVDTKGAWTFSQFFRVLGTGDRLVVHRLPSPLDATTVEDDVLEGRLARFGELPFEDAVRAYFAAHVAASHFFAPKDLRDALARGGAVRLRDLAGDQAAVAPDDQLFVDVVRPNEVRVGLPNTRWAQHDDAAAEIAKRGGVVVADKDLVKAEAPSAGGAALAFSTPRPATERWTFVVRFPPEARDAALGALADLDPKVEIRDARETLRVRLADLAATDDGLSLRPGGGSERRVVLADVAAVRTLATSQIPDDAYLLVEGDRPRDHFPTLFLALAVAVFGVVNLGSVARELRR